MKPRAHVPPMPVLQIRAAGAAAKFLYHSESKVGRGALLDGLLHPALRAAAEPWPPSRAPALPSQPLCRCAPVLPSQPQPLCRHLPHACLPHAPRPPSNPWVHLPLPQVNPGRGERPYSDLEVVKELRAMSNSTSKKAKVAPRVSGGASSAWLMQRFWSLLARCPDSCGLQLGRQSRAVPSPRPIKPAPTNPRQMRSSSGCPGPSICGCAASCGASAQRCRTRASGAPTRRWPTPCSATSFSPSSPACQTARWACLFSRGGARQGGGSTMEGV